MLSLQSWLEVIRTIVGEDQGLQDLNARNAYYQVAPAQTGGEFVVHLMMGGSFGRTLDALTDISFIWQFAGVSGDRDGVSGLQRADAIALRLWEMFDLNEDLFSEHLEPLGWECELVRGTTPVPPRLQDIGGSQKWRYGFNFEFLLQPL